MHISETEKSKLTNCLDLLGVALATHGHQWTDGERQAYEEATSILTSSDDCKATGSLASG
jgi:hypothetical protein